MRYFHFVICFVLCLDVFCQTDKESIEKQFLRVLDFDESKLDSMRIYASQIEKQSKLINFTLGVAYAYRLRGIASELESKFEDASKHYIDGLKFSEEVGDNEAKLIMLSDLGSLNVSLKQYQNAKNHFNEALRIAQNLTTKPKRLSALYQNLGICHRNLQEIDSAIINYKRSLEIKRKIGDSTGIANLGINMSTLLVSQKKYDEAKKLLDFNVDYHTKNNQIDDLWNDYLNLSGVFIPLKKYNEAKKYIDLSLDIAQKLNSESKIKETYEVYSSYYQAIGDYKNAYEYYLKYSELEKKIINLETNTAIAELEKKYLTDKKNQENKLLSTELQSQKQQKIILLLVSLAIAILGLVIAYALWQNKKKNHLLQLQNDFIQTQNIKLAELNTEKNQLISVVSHDLGSPFSTIKLWGKVLSKNKSLDSEAIEATEIINKMAEYGQNMIWRILQVEKSETENHSINLTNIELNNFLDETIEGFRPALDSKEIMIQKFSSKKEIWFISDYFYLNRIVENILSNAIKYSYRNSKILVNLRSENRKIEISVQDFGVGIEDDEQKKLFSRFSNINSQPTENESSTGLGLHIVKRLVDELGGEIRCESEPSKGSTFTVIFDS